MKTNKIIFITGASRSGTTLLNRVLGKHSDILGLQELHFFGELWHPFQTAQGLSARRLERMAAQLFARQKRSVIDIRLQKEDWLDGKNLVSDMPPAKRTGADLFRKFVFLQAARFNKSCVSEHTPRNIFYANELLTLFPEAVVLHMVRDPRAVAASQKNRWKRRWKGGRFSWRETTRVWINYHPFTIYKLWQKANNAALNLRQHARLKIIRFEDLVANPEMTINEICHFIGIDMESEMLQVTHTGSSHFGDNPNAGIFSTDTLHQWRHVLTENEIHLCETRNGRLMHHFAYAASNSGKVSWHLYILPLLKYPFHAAGAILLNPKRVLIHLKAILLPANHPKNASPEKRRGS